MIQFRKLDWKFNGMDIKKAVVEVLIVFIVGALIGSVLAVVSNLFVEGVDFLSNIRGDFNLLEVAIGEATFNFAPVMFLVCAAAIVVIIRNLLKIQKWAGPADAMYAAHQVQEPLDLKKRVWVHFSSLHFGMWRSFSRAVWSFGALWSYYRNMGEEVYDQ